jgi:hypothetical protein
VTDQSVPRTEALIAAYAALRHYREAIHAGIDSAPTQWACAELATDRFFELMGGLPHMLRVAGENEYDAHLIAYAAVRHIG